MCKIGHIQCDGCDERIVPLYFLSSTQWMDMMSYYDDEDNIGRCGGGGEEESCD